jgi:uncharacterized protein YycO
VSKTTRKMKKKIAVFIGVVVACVSLSVTAKAQDNKDKISVSITKEVDGEQKKFEKTYDSAEEMMADEDYKEFAGDDNFTWISTSNDSDKEIIVKNNSDDEGAYTIATSGGEDLQVVNLKNLSEEMARVEVEIKKVLENIDEESVTTIQKVIKNLEDERVMMISTDESDLNVSISDVDKSDFGKNAVISDDEKLDLADLKIRTLGDQLIIKYPLNQTTDIRLSLQDKSGDELFVSRVLEADEDINQFIDLSQHRAGDYLLLLKVGEKKLAKKISITKKE